MYVLAVMQTVISNAIIIYSFKVVYFVVVVFIVAQNIIYLPVYIHLRTI